MKKKNNVKMTGTEGFDDRRSTVKFTDKGHSFTSGDGKGVRMEKWKPFSDFVLNNLVNKADIINPEALLPSDGRPVIAIAAHGPGFAWVPLAALVGKFFIDNGYGDIIGGMYPHKAMFLIPGLKGYYKKVLGTPTDVNTVDDIVELLKNNDIGITGTAPEGANCLLSFDEYVAPFRSKGMIAAAIKADTGVCLMAHQGAEDWTIQLNLPFGWSVPMTTGLRGINITLPPYKKISNYRVLCRRYHPSITSHDLKNKTKREVRLLLNVEIEKIRAEMNLMTDELKELSKNRAGVLRLAKPRKKKTLTGNMLDFHTRLFPADEAY